MERFKRIWKGSKDGSSKEERSFLRYAVIITSAFLVFFCFIKRDNLFRWIEAGLTVRKQEKQIEFYQSDIKRLQEELGNLTNDTDSLEQFAREKFLFSEPDEDVYVVE